MIIQIPRIFVVERLWPQKNQPPMLKKITNEYSNIAILLVFEIWYALVTIETAIIDEIA